MLDHAAFFASLLFVFATLPGCGGSGSYTVPPDTTPPTAPTNLAAAAASGTQINLSWTASTDNVGVTGYRVERCQGAGCNNFAQIATPTATSFGDTGLAASTSYSYRVRATDATGNLSNYSSVATATTQAGVDTTPPTAPTNLTAAAASSSQISLSWTASTDNVGVTGYLVERCQGAGCNNFAQIATPTATTYNDTALTVSTSYSYRVRATDAAGNLSSYSNVASSTTLNSNIVVSILPKRGAVTTSQSLQFSATVTGTQTTGVNWLVDGAVNGNATVGTISGGLYKPGTAIGSHIITAQSVVDGSPSNAATIAVTNLNGYFSWRGTGKDTTRQGVNPSEYALTTSTVNSATFGKLFSCALDGFVFAQPLYVANLKIGATTHNVIYVATENDSLYAFDADNPSCSSVWSTPKVSLLPTGETAANSGDAGEVSMGPQVGITSTPVIDPASKTLYTVTVSEAGGPPYIQRLHAIDLFTGNEKFGGPVVISASVPGTGSGSNGTSIFFDPTRNNQRPGLLLLNGVVYIAWASHDDNPPYHGWVIAYSYNGTALTQTAAFSPTPQGTYNNGQEGGIWMTGAAPAADSGNNVYLSVGNGTFDDTLDMIPPMATANDFGDSVLKLNLSGNTLSVADYFAPDDQMTLNVGDIDLGSTGVVLLPDLSGNSPTHLMFCGGKDGNIYLLNRDNLGRYMNASNNIVQYFQLSGDTTNGFRSTPAFFNNTLYGAGAGDPLKAVSFSSSSRTFSMTPASQSTETYGGFGTTPMVSAIVTAQGTSNGIVWTIDYGPGVDTMTPGQAAILRAYDATNLASKLYDSSQQGARDQTGLAVKFTVPTVANGKVYVGTQTELDVFGLLPN